MTEIINLRQARKARNRQEKEKQAEANRALFGRTKGQKAKDKAEADKLNRHLDGHKLTTLSRPDKAPEDGSEAAT
ncbi:DUF4169 family protein [Cohaesibacter sp. CAU 1516]|uniref:DUF4169 family protein n=1 Tax=Cohaesibacter sp. CAU 1516 TaxID=2576038 RepID=UPI0010FDBF2A|nr:DUF4169 family protein [Cohaesibacter sp. CAU 1516]TLP48459.1 DUF4169 family protein [Cohaesibacter sp. CAU 1516]